MGHGNQGLFALTCLVLPCVGHGNQGLFALAGLVLCGSWERRSVCSALSCLVLYCVGQGNQGPFVCPDLSCVGHWNQGLFSLTCLVWSCVGHGNQVLFALTCLVLPRLTCPALTFPFSMISLFQDEFLTVPQAAVPPSAYLPGSMLSVRSSDGSDGFLLDASAASAGDLRKPPSGKSPRLVDKIAAFLVSNRW